MSVRQNSITQMKFGQIPCVNTPALGQSTKALLKVEGGQGLILQLIQNPIIFALTNGLYINYLFRDVLQLCIIRGFLLLVVSTFKIYCQSLLLWHLFSVLFFPILSSFSPFKFLQALFISCVSLNNKNFWKSQSS